MFPVHRRCLYRDESRLGMFPSPRPSEVQVFLSAPREYLLQTYFLLCTRCPERVFAASRVERNASSFDLPRGGFVPYRFEFFQVRETFHNVLLCLANRFGKEFILRSPAEFQSLLAALYLL